MRYDVSNILLNKSLAVDESPPELASLKIDYVDTDKLIRNQNKISQ